MTSLAEAYSPDLRRASALACCGPSVIVMGLLLRMAAPLLVQIYDTVILGERGSPQQLHQIRLILPHLLHLALLRRLVRPPPQQPRPMPEAAAGEMVVADLDNELR